CDVPPVATRVGGNQELIEDGETGYLVTTGDVPALASKISALIRDRSLCDSMGANARASVERFSTGAMVSAHLAAYKHLLAPGDRP
ncbi:MAG TPA: glycosyltransferase, partial [Candidatus Eisenbacteria bacterium]|nr:glycosyltransferase [Candidatus Eisenbacteria bacterium]